MEPGPFNHPPRDELIGRVRKMLNSTRPNNIDQAGDGKSTATELIESDEEAPSHDGSEE
jgi:hypothetical protein